MPERLLPKMHFEGDFCIGCDWRRINLTESSKVLCLLSGCPVLFSCFYMLPSKNADHRMLLLKVSVTKRGMPLLRTLRSAHLTLKVHGRSCQ